MHQWVLEINTVSHEITGNSDPVKLEGRTEYLANELAVSPVVEAKIEQSANNGDVTLLKQTLISRGFKP
jgi:hypothetical protein